MAEKQKNLLNIFIIDPYFWEKCDIHENRLNFLLESLRDLDQNLRAKGSQLTLLFGSPQDVFTKLSPHVSKIAWEVDTEPYSRERDSQVEDICIKAGAEVSKLSGHTLLKTEDLA